MLIGLQIPPGPPESFPFPGAYGLSFEVVDPSGRAVVLPWIAQTRG